MIIGYLPLAGMLALCGLAGWTIFGWLGAMVVSALALTVTFVVDRRSRSVAPHDATDQPRRKRLSPGFADRFADLCRTAGFGGPAELRWVEGAPNAYAVSSRNNPRVVVSESLHDLLSERQLLTVIAHELSHARSGDADQMRRGETLGRAGLVAALCALIIGAGAFLLQGRSIAPDWAWWTLAFGPTVLSWIYLALMRRREYGADADAARLTGDPQALSQALARIQFATEGPPDLKSTIEEYAGMRARGWWRTHPPIEQRIQRLNGRGL